jgi:hypothetical protein
MSVIFDHRRRHGDDEQGATQAGRDGNGSLWGLAYERIEGVVHLTLAFTIVGGAAVILSSALFSPGAPLGGPIEPPLVSAQAGLAPAAPVAIKEAAAPAAEKQPAQAPEPVQQSAAAAPADPFLSARPIAESTAPATAATGPRPLTPPTADTREKLVARQDIAPEPEAPADEAIAPPEASAYEAAPAAPAAVSPPAPVSERAAAPAAPAKAVAEAPKADTGGRMAKCYFKLAGRVQSSAACRVDHSGQSVLFHLPGKPLEIVHENGRVWSATLGGRNLGRVYRNKDAPCWGAKGFYACENG